MNEEELNRLTEKYYNGLSTDEDEMLLRAYFSGDSVLPGYEAEKEIFGYYMDSGNIPEPSAGFNARIIQSVDPSPVKNRETKIRKLLLPLSGAAAGLLILAGSWFLLVSRTESRDTFSDPRIAYAETMKILMDVSSRMNSAAGMLSPVSKINEVKEKSLEPINRSALILEKNLRSLDYLKVDSDVVDPVNNK
jgi:hypothetical protein